MDGSKSKCPVTLEEIEAITDLAQANALSQRFDPPVYLKKCPTVEKRKERLRLALKKAQGQLKDIDELGNVMRKRKDIDHQTRNTLLSFFHELKKILDQMDDKMRRQVESEYAAIQPKEQIEKFSRQLAEPPTNMVVAGETSSGKSTLLNIFITENKDEELLPTKLLSCTATICELKYGEERSAKLIYKDKEEAIDFNKRHQYIYTESERDGYRKQFDHDSVQLNLPAPFLKSGITLVDTPGIGESKEMGNVLKNFVKNNDVFGFVFTVASSRAGGMLPKFLSILRDLSTDEYVDKYGQRKFNPSCCIFVSNFWDEVPDKDKDSTKQNIYDTLSSLPFMSNFIPEEQVFLLDANFAYHTKHAGLVTEDFSDFIDGLSEFVYKEQKRKLKHAYGWLENALQRILHPVRSYIRQLGQKSVVRRKNKNRTARYLDDLEKKFESVMSECRKDLLKNVVAVSDKLLEYMMGPEANKKIGSWKTIDVPKEELGNDWVLTEIELDEAIDERVSDILQQWEKENQIVSKAERELMLTFQLHFQAIDNELEAVEREIRSTNQHIELSDEQTDYEEESILNKSINLSLQADLAEGKEFAVSFGRTYGSDIMMENIVDSIASGPALKILQSKGKVKPAVNDSQQYAKDKVGYLTDRAKRIFSKMCSKEFTMTAIKEQFDPFLDYLDSTEKNTLRLLHSNRKLLQEIADDKRSKGEVRKLYAPVEEEIVKLFDSVLMFGKSNVSTPDYADTDFLSVPTNFERKSLFSTLATGKHIPKAKKALKRYSTTLPKPEDVTFKKSRGFATPSLKPSDRYFQEKNIRQFAKRGDIVKLLGIYHLKGERLLVLEGSLYTARQHLLSGNEPKNVYARRQLFVGTCVFLHQLGSAVAFLHLKKLVHVEVSLDSIMVKRAQKGIAGSGVPLLCNLSEPTRVPICPNHKIPVGQYIHLPPEVLREKSLYTQEADMYGLGIIMLELWHLKDLLEETKHNVPLGRWIEKDDQGEALIQVGKQDMKKYPPGEKMTQKWKDLMYSCLQKDPWKRTKARCWQDDMTAIMNTTLS